MEARRSNRYNTANIVPSRSAAKKNKTTKLSTQILKKEECTDCTDKQVTLYSKSHPASAFLFGSTPTRT